MNLPTSSADSGNIGGKSSPPAMREDLLRKEDLRMDEIRPGIAESIARPIDEPD